MAQVWSLVWELDPTYLNIVPMKTPAGNFAETDKLFLKFTCKAKNAGYQNNPQKERTERYTT